MLFGLLKTLGGGLRATPKSGRYAVDASGERPLAPLEYADTFTRPELPPPWRTVPLRVALFCWGIPLGLGTITFVVMLFPNFIKSDEIGAVSVELGVFSVFVGGVAIAVFAATRWEQSAGDRWCLTVRPALAATALLASNFLVAAGMIAILVLVRGLD